MTRVSRRLLEILREIHILPAEDSDQRLMITSISKQQIVEIFDILTQPCPFWREKRVQETHVSCLMFEPDEGIADIVGDLQDISRQLFTGGCLVIFPKGERRTSQPTAMVTAGKIYKVYLAFMTRDVIPDSCYKSYREQHDMVCRKSGYDLPLSREVAQMVLTHKIRFSKEAKCKDDLRGGQMVVSEDRCVYPDSYEGDWHIGAAAIRRIPLGHCKLENRG